MTNTPKEQAELAHAPGNEGEGSRTAARAYDKATRDFIASGKVEDAAREAAHDLDGDQAKALREAEAEGLRHSHGEDPALRRKGP
jgi:hypothetical protein